MGRCKQDCVVPANSISTNFSLKVFALNIVYRTSFAAD
jgi:hypothetical protein